MGGEEGATEREGEGMEEWMKKTQDVINSLKNGLLYNIYIHLCIIFIINAHSYILSAIMSCSTACIHRPVYQLLSFIISRHA